MWELCAALQSLHLSHGTRLKIVYLNKKYKQVPNMVSNLSNSLIQEVFDKVKLWYEPIDEASQDLKQEFYVIRVVSGISNNFTLLYNI